MILEKMNPAHVSQIAQLEKICFSDPWSENSIASELKNPLSQGILHVFSVAKRTATAALSVTDTS